MSKVAGTSKMSNKIKTIIRHIIAVLAFPTDIPGLLFYAKTIYKAMNGNANFPASASKLATLNADNGLLDAAEIALHTKPPTTTTEARDVLKENVKNDLRALRSDVQAAADANAKQAEAIVVSAAMKVKQSGGRGKQQNTVQDGKEEGSVELTGEGNGPHEWRTSTDEVNWTPLRSTSKSTNTVKSLALGIKHFFQNRQILTNGEESEWSQVISIRVR